jgi:hypothetical protein
MHGKCIAHKLADVATEFVFALTNRRVRREGLVKRYFCKAILQRPTAGLSKRPGPPLSIH